MKKNILICQPNMYFHSEFFPNVWATLKSYCEQFVDIRENFNWLSPAFKGFTPEELLAPYNLKDIDVLCLSCYLWNTQLNFEIARRVKQHNPRAVIIVGGPDIDFTDSDFLQNHSFIDIVVRGEGENAFLDLLRWVAHGFDFSANNLRELPLQTDAAFKYYRGKKLTDFGPSPVKEIFDSLKSFGGGGKRLAWETNRGCPYECSFCDWGSATNSKIRVIDLARIHEEIEMMPKLKVSELFITDANFGMFARDLEIAEHLCEIKKATGYPTSVIYSDTKNNVDRVVEIAQLFHSVNLIESHSLGFQHLDTSILSNMNRSNMPIERLKQKVVKLKQTSIPAAPGLMLGSPGDSLQKIESAYYQLMEMGLHDEYRWTIWHLLPGTPAWEMDYRQKFKIKYVERGITVIRRKKNLSYQFATKIKYIVETNSYNRDEWVEMYLHSVFMEAMHNSGLTRFLAIYFARTGISYGEFYSKLKLWIENNTDSFMGKLFKNCKDHLHRWLDDSSGVIYNEIEIEELVHSNCYYSVEEYFYFRMILNSTITFGEIESFCKTELPQSAILDDLILYQQEIMITEDYCFLNQKVIATKYDWHCFFKSDDLNVPGSMNGAKYNVQTQYIGSHRDIATDWSRQRDVRKKRLQFSDAVFGSAYRRINRTFHTELELIHS